MNAGRATKTVLTIRPGKSDGHATPPTWPAFAAALDELLASLRQLDALASEKLAALRQADSKRLEACAAEEGELLAAVLAQGPRRGALLADVAQRLLGDVRGAPTLAMLAERLPEPQASNLRAKSLLFEKVTGELQRKNRLAGQVARKLQEHVRGIFADVAKSAQTQVGYGKSGPSVLAGASCYVEAVG